MALNTPENRKILIVDNKLPDLEFDLFFYISSEKTERLSPDGGM